VEARQRVQLTGTNSSIGLIYALKKNFQLKQTPIILIDIIFTLKRKRAHKKLWAFFYINA
jgi:hypothetical protein